MSSEPASIQIQRATVADASRMTECRSGDQEAGPADARMADYLDGRHHPQKALAGRAAFLATADGDVAGYIAGHLTRRFACEGELQYLYVAPAFRRSGIASMLLQELSRWFGEQGAARICVDVNDDSPGARPFYASLGAQPLRPHWMFWPNIQTTLSARE